MTNSWTDIGNASMVLVWGANPSENHPACMAHINAARAKGASLVVVGPRKTRTALQADRYIRIRPGTDIALENAVIRGIIANMEARDVADAARVKWFANLNQTANGSFYTDGVVPLVVTGESQKLVGTTANSLAKSGAISGSVTVTSSPAGTTYVEGTDYTISYTAGTIVRIAGGAITDGQTVLVNYSAGSYLKTDVAGSAKYSDARFLVKADGSDYDRDATINTGTAGQISNFPKKAANVSADPYTVYNRLKAHVAPYDSATVADICGCTTADIDFLVSSLIANGRCSSAGTGVSGADSDADPRITGYKATTILYAMGMTQHTNASTGIKGFANIQTLMGNMGRAGGGINALRGIHNVQGSTDMGLLYGNIPAYSSNPTLMTSGHATPASNDANAFGKYMNSLWGNPLSGTGVRASMDSSYDDAYVTQAMGLQQRGFYNMTRAWFGDPAWATTGRTNVSGIYDLWPKSNGDDHITMFRQMASGGYTKALVSWGQNPAVTEPNQSAVRAGLQNLDTLVVVDTFETETAACDRKSDGVTYLIPACSYVEEAGSVTNSARTLQWREQATSPKGNSKPDMELLLRLAYALDKPAVDAFAHLKAEWTSKAYSFTSAYASLYGRYGWTPGSATAFQAVTFSDSDTQVWTGTSTTPSAAGVTLTASEAICERIYREEMAPVASGGTLWIYTGAYNNGTKISPSASGYMAWQTDNVHPSIGKVPTDPTLWSGDVWLVRNRAKSRDNRDGNLTTGTKAYGGWGYSWLVNRRVFYNNGEIPGDVADYFMSPDSVSRLFVSTNTGTLNYSRWYRTIHQLKDMPDVCLPMVGTVGTPTATHIVPGRFPSYTEPYETPRAGDATYMAKWGRNTKGTAQWDLVKSSTNVAGKTAGFPASDYPLVLTTIRCVEHFQGGPTTRNNSWNIEAEPVPWIEINSVDAAKYNIVDGQWVNVTTARSNSTTNQEGRSPNSTAGWARGFKARVGVGINANQRVDVGVVAIPWHWGDKGLSTGSRANDLCIDAGDANSVIPEYKACLCKIEGM